MRFMPSKVVGYQLDIVLYEFIGILDENVQSDWGWGGWGDAGQFVELFALDGAEGDAAEGDTGQFVELLAVEAMISPSRQRRGRRRTLDHVPSV